MRISETQFFLDRDAGIGLQAQLRERIASAILARRFMPGQRMPSSRRLAQHLEIARITVSLVYQDLVADGYLEAAARSGFFVAQDAPDLMSTAPRPERSTQEEKETWEGWLSGRFAKLRLVEKAHDWRAYPYPFIYGQIDHDLFPHDDWRDCARRALGKRDFDQVSGDAYLEDDPMLVSHILSHSLPARGINAWPEEVLVTLGAQQAIWLVVELLSNARTPLRVAIEEPGYPGLREVLRLAGCTISLVPVDQDGMIPEAVPEDIDLVCATPSHQAPTCVTMPMERRNALLAMADARDFLILEDDYDFEMSFLKAASPALKSLDKKGRVIHVASFSKSLFPGLRLGYLHGPAPFIEEARNLRALVMRHPPGTPQRTTAHFLALGHYNAHVHRLREAFRRRRAVMTTALEQHGLQVAAQSNFGGAGFWIEGPRDVDTASLAETLKAEGVLIEPGAPFYASENPPRHFFRIAYSSISENRIPEGVRRLARAISR